MATPQAVSLAVGSMLVLLLSYRDIFWIIAVFIAAGAAHILFWLRRDLGPMPPLPSAVEPPPSVVEPVETTPAIRLTP